MAKGVTLAEQAAARTLRARRMSPSHRRRATDSGAIAMLTLILWLLLFVFCWPLALLALVLYPIVWLLLLPFRLLGFAVEGVFSFLRALLLLPARVLRGRPVPR
jgi:hypothetical protein